eukprot:gene16609-22851_t
MQAETYAVYEQLPNCPLDSAHIPNSFSSSQAYETRHSSRVEEAHWHEPGEERIPEVNNNTSDSLLWATTGGLLSAPELAQPTLVVGAFVLSLELSKASMIVEEDAGSMKLNFILKESSFMRAFEGKWKVTPALVSSGKGEAVVEACVVDHQLSVKPNVDVPAPIAEMMQGIFVKQVSRIMEDLLQEIERKQNTST